MDQKDVSKYYILHVENKKSSYCKAMPHFKTDRMISKYIQNFYETFI